MCIAEIGMCRADFFCYSLYELYVILNAHRKNQQRQWYHTRMIAYCNMTSSWASKKRPPSINRYMPLDDLDNDIEDKFLIERLEILRKAKDQYEKKVSLKKIK